MYSFLMLTSFITATQLFRKTVIFIECLDQHMYQFISYFLMKENTFMTKME